MNTNRPHPRSGLWFVARSVELASDAETDPDAVIERERLGDAAYSAVERHFCRTVEARVSIYLRLHLESLREAGVADTDSPALRTALSDGIRAAILCRPIPVIVNERPRQPGYNDWCPRRETVAAVLTGAFVLAGDFEKAAAKLNYGKHGAEDMFLTKWNVREAVGRFSRDLVRIYRRGNAHSLIPDAAAALAVHNLQTALHLAGTYRAADRIWPLDVQLEAAVRSGAFFDDWAKAEDAAQIGFRRDLPKYGLVLIQHMAKELSAILRRRSDADCALPGRVESLG